MARKELEVGCDTSPRVPSVTDTLPRLNPCSQLTRAFGRSVTRQNSALADAPYYQSRSCEALHDGMSK